MVVLSGSQVEYKTAEDLLFRRGFVSVSLSGYLKSVGCSSSALSVVDSSAEFYTWGKRLYLLDSVQLSESVGKGKDIVVSLCDVTELVNSFSSAMLSVRENAVSSVRVTSVDSLRAVSGSQILGLVFLVLQQSGRWTIPEAHLHRVVSSVSSYLVTVTDSSAWIPAWDLSGLLKLHNDLFYIVDGQVCFPRRDLDDPCEVLRGNLVFGLPTDLYEVLWARLSRHELLQ